jgi:fibronectin-binding autotransporter adhesin
MTSVNGVILARTGSSRRKGLANVAVTGYDVNLNEIYIDVSSTNDSGGNIDIEATNDVVGGKISLISNGKNEGGDINVVSLFGDVNLQQSIVQTNASLGRGGTVNINAKQNIFLIDSNLYARGSPEGGNVTILSSANDVNLKSTLIQTNGSTGRGGTIELSGFNHTIIQSSSFYSKGSNKGGNIYIGNNFYEKTIPFSKYTYIDPYSIIDATSSNFGGFVETSGQILELLSKINVGYEGLWLIDPYDVTIASSGDSGTSYSSSFTPSETTTILASSVISSLNAGTSVSITTGSSTQNTLTVNAAIAKTSGSSATLTLTGGFIDINADISSTSDGLNLTLNAATMDITSNLSLNGGDLTINNSSDSTFSGVFSGSENSRLLKNGAGILTLNGTNTYSGATYLYNGTLIISSDANLGTAPAEATASHLILQGGRLKTTTTMTLNSNRGMYLGASYSRLEVANDTTLTYNGIITGASTTTDLVLNMSGTTGTLVLGGTSTYTGSTKIYDGTLSISDELNLGPTSCNSFDCIELFNAGVLQITDDVTFGSNQGIKISNSDNTKILIATGKTLTLNHEFYNNGSGGYVLTINDGSHDGKLHMTTSAEITSSRNNSYHFTDYTNGGFVVANGTLQLDDYRNLVYDYSSSYKSYLTMASGSTLILNYTNNQQHLDLILQGVTVELLQNQNWYGNVTLSGTNTFNVAENKTWSTSSGSWNNASGQTGAITKTGAGTLTLGNSTSNWTGLTTVTAGTLRTNTNNALGTSAGGVQVNGGVLDVRNTLADEITLNGGTLYGYGGTISNTITLSQNSTIEAGSTTTITGVITDGDNSYSVTKTGNGLLYLSSSSGNTYDGGTTISAGEIEVRNHNDNLGTGTVTIDDGAGLDVYNRTINNSLIINGAYTSSYGNLFSSNTGTYTGTILMNAAASIGGNGTLTISGVIDDGGNNYTLTKIGTGTVYLTATNTYGGGTIIQDGYLGIDNDDNLGDLPGSTDADNIQLGTSNAFLFATADVTINTARGITLLADGNALGADSGDQLTYDGIITGDYNLKIERDSNGTVVLGGTNTYSGSTEISAGTLKISADANLGTAPAEATANHLYLSGGRLHTTATITLNSNRGMYLGASYSRLEVANDTTLTYNGIITGASTTTDLVLNMSGTTGTLVLGGTSTYTGSTKIYDGTLSISDELNLGPTSCNSFDCIELFNAGVLQITDDVTFGSNQGIKISNSDNTKILIATGKTLTLNHEFYNNGSGGHVLTINDGSHDGKLHMTTSAEITSSRNNSYHFTDYTNGGFVVANGTLQLDDYRNLVYDYSSSYKSYLTMASGSTLILNYTNNQQHLDLILQGVTVELLQNQNWYGNVTLSGTNTFNVAENKTWSTSSGSWNNASGQTGAITKTGAGTLTLGNSTSNWTGLTTVTAGTLRTNTNNALGTSAGGVQVNGGVLDVRNTLADEITLNGGTLYGYGGTISNTITLSQNSTIEAGSTTTITGVITDGDNSYSVTKTGNGLLYLSSSSGNTYDGGTTISAGEIEVRNHNDNLGTGTVTIDDGAGLDVYNRTINNSLIINGAYTSSYGNLFSSNTGTYTGTILMNAAASIGGNGTLTISGVIDDGGNNYTLTKIGTGTVYLTATNTYGGGTIIQDGYLGIDNDDNLGDLPGSTDADNIQLGTSNAFLFATADVTINTARGITLLADGNALGADSGDQLTYDGIITGDYNLKIERDSNGTVVLGGTNTYSGSTEISAGTLKISADANLGTAPAEATANHLYLSGGRLHTTATITLNSNRGMYLGASYSRLEVANDTTLTYNGIITGASTTTDLVLNMSGTTGTLVLGGTSTYTGSTKIYDGTLSISDELNLGPTSCNSFDCIELFNAGVLQITDDVTFGSNQGIKISNSDNTKILIATGKTLTLNHEFYNNGSGGHVLTINDGSHDGKLHMTTSAEITSSRNNSYHFTDYTNGGFVVANGTLQLDDYRNLVYDYSSSYKSYLTMASGSTLILNYTNNQQHLDLILQGVTVELLQNQNWYGNVTLSGTNTFNVAENKTWSTSSGSWNNASGQTGAITKTGAGTLTLGNSTSNWTGLTTVTAGTLRTNTNNALGTSAGGVQVNGGVLDVRNTLADEITLNGGTLYGYGGTISNTITLSQNSTIEAGSTTTITGVITDGDNSYSVTKTGNGLLYLSSSSGNTYDGGTTISAGEIEVRNHNDNLGTGTVTITMVQD